MRLRRRKNTAHTTPRLLSVGILTAGLMVTPAFIPSAVAEPGDGTVTVRVVQDVNANGLVDDPLIEPPFVATTVRLVDAAGQTLTAETDADGRATFDLASSALTGGAYRVSVENPRPEVFHPAHAAQGQSPAAEPVTEADLADPTNVKLSSATEFVDVSGGQDAFVNVAFWFPSYYCQDNAALCGVVQPWDAPPGGISADTEKTLISVPYQFTAANAVLATKAETGSVYGVAYDRIGERLFSAAFAKRGSAYGPGGPGAIYVTNLDNTTHPLTGSTSQWASVPNPGTDNHELAVNSDAAFFDHVGKESLGDLDITHDGRYLFGVNMFDKTAFVYDLTTDNYRGSYPIPNPGCGTDWRPMGTGIGLDTAYVGGVCSGESARDMEELSAHVYAFDPATGTFGPRVIDQPLTYDRGRTYKGSNCDGSVSGTNVGRWFSWVDAYPVGPNEQRAAGCGPGGWIGYPTPILGDIVEETNGDLILAFRDRFADQAGFNVANPDGDGRWVLGGQPASGGDLIRGCRLSDDTFVLDPHFDDSVHQLAPGAICADNNASSTNSGGQPTTYREYFVGDWRTGFNEEAIFAGIALSRVENNVVGSAINATGEVWTQGIAAVGRDGRLPAGTLGTRTDQGTSDRWGEAAGMGGLDVLCELAPTHLSGRVWRDLDVDGLQGAAEPAIEGVTVRLYDGATEVATTTSDARGRYVFDDRTVALDTDAEYTVAIDEAADYAGSGPLRNVVPADTGVGDDPTTDSDGAVTQGEYSTATVTLGGAGENQAHVDFGFRNLTATITADVVDSTGAEAGSPSEAVAFEPGETRTLNFSFTNTGEVDLTRVTVTTASPQGGDVTEVRCDFPGGSVDGSLTGDTWTMAWDDTWTDAVWAPGTDIECQATLTLEGTAPPHESLHSVTATAAELDETATAHDRYFAFTGDVQVVMYDGRDDFHPAVDTEGVPIKPLADPSRDANLPEDRAEYVADSAGTAGPHPVRWTATNLGRTWLADIDVTADTSTDPALTGISCDFSAVGGPASGTTWAGPWEPGSSFDCEGELVLSESESVHASSVLIGGSLVGPMTDADFDAADPDSPAFLTEPRRDDSGELVLSDVRVTDADAFHAARLAAPVEGPGEDSGSGSGAGGLLPNVGFGSSVLALVALGFMLAGWWALHRGRRRPVEL